MIGAIRLPLAVAAAGLLLAACGAAPGGQRPTARPGPHGRPPGIPANGAVDRPGPQADPGNCVQSGDRGERDAEIYASWHSQSPENPTILWTKNGVTLPAGNLQTIRGQRDIVYSGEWAILVRVKCHDTLALDVKGTARNFGALCAIIDLDDGPVKTGERGCAVSYVVR